MLIHLDSFVFIFHADCCYLLCHLSVDNMILMQRSVLLTIYMSAILYNGSLFCIDIMCQYPSVMARITEHLVCIDYNKHLHNRIYLTCTLIHIIQSWYLTCHWIITHSKPQSCLTKWCYISLDCLSKLVDSAAGKWSSHAIHHWRSIWYVYLIRLLLIFHCNSVQLYVFD